MEGKKANWILWKFFTSFSINVKHFSISFGTKTYTANIYSESTVEKLYFTSDYSF